MWLLVPLQAYATLRYSPGVALLNGAAAHAVYCMPRFKPQEVGLVPIRCATVCFAGTWQSPAA